MNKFICRIIVSFFKKSENTILALMTLLLLIILACLFFLADKIGTNAFTIFTAIICSIIASIVILIIYSLIDKKKETIIDIYNKFGLTNLYEKKTDAVADFNEALKKCKQRVWAIGITNKAFIKQQKNSFNNLIENNCSIDIKIVFWDDCSKIVNNNEVFKSIIDVQLALENQLSISCFNDILEQKLYKDIINTLKEIDNEIKEEYKENIEIGFITSPSNFSCLVIDDNVFFYPFLSTGESNSTPMILCDAKGIIGKSILEHYEYLFKSKPYYRNYKLKTISENLKNYENCSNWK